ncbi:MAG: hypothetical protein MAG795_00926 [Candidatus Woesearchaeota archaeon]|nr:hypothetical protein [Candidatus Woesearchaeota archaeon]
MKFSKKEIIDLLKSWFLVSIAFIIYLRLGFNLSALLFSTLTIGLGFIIHELAHKFVAQKYGCYAEFRSNDKMLLLGIVSSFFSFLFLAPGAVGIYGKVNPNQRGKISAAGPATNLILALIFLILVLIGIQPQITSLGLLINSWLGIFNLIPIPGFDGQKILAWNKLVYTGMIISASILMILQSVF